MGRLNWGFGAIWRKTLLWGFHSKYWSVSELSLTRFDLCACLYQGLKGTDWDCCSATKLDWNPKLIHTFSWRGIDGQIPNIDNGVISGWLIRSGEVPQISLTVKWWPDWQIKRGPVWNLNSALQLIKCYDLHKRRKRKSLMFYSEWAHSR